MLRVACCSNAKDLRLLGRPLERTLLIDNADYALAAQPSNGVRVHRHGCKPTCIVSHCHLRAHPPNSHAHVHSHTHARGASQRIAVAAPRVGNFRDLAVRRNKHCVPIRSDVWRRGEAMRSSAVHAQQCGA